ncbi:centromere protein T-like [Lineus longissimus]|uniref:centromere protein T-like n=1 Tax=Lineus longissimus TaxID=88925 RepID=UPI002B4C7C54
MSSPLTPRTLIGKVLGELKTSKPVQRQSKRRKSSSSSRRQSLNDSTLRKQALLSSANRTEHSISSNDGELTPRSQIQEFLNAAKTGVAVVRKKRHTDRDNVDDPEERSAKRMQHATTSFLDNTEETPRTLISNILSTTETGMTGAPVKHRRNLLRSPYTRSRKENESLQNSGSRSPNSDSSLLDLTIHNKESEGRFGHVPRIKPKPTGLAYALSQVNSTSPSSGNTSAFIGTPTGVEDTDTTQRLTRSHDRLSLIPETPLDGREEEGDEEEEEEDDLDGGEEELGGDMSVGLDMVESVSTSSAGGDDDMQSVPDLSSFYKPSGSTQQGSVSVNKSAQGASQSPLQQIQSLNAQSGSGINNQSVREQSASVHEPSMLNQGQSQSMRGQTASFLDQSGTFLHSTTQRELMIPLEVPKKPRIQLEIAFPVIRKQVSIGGLQKRTRKPSAASRQSRSSAGTNKKVNSAFNLPRSLIKEIFCHFSKCKNVTSGALDEIERVTDQFWRQFTSDVTAFADHAGRVSVTEADVELLMRRQGFVTDNQSMYTLVEKYLPLEDREQIIPVAKAGNKVIPHK